MRAHLEAYGISPEFVAADNHRANGLAKWVIRDFNNRMNLTCKHHWKKWHKTIKDTALSLRTNPNEDTGISPAEFMFGRPMRTTFGGLPASWTSKRTPLIARPKGSWPHNYERWTNLRTSNHQHNHTNRKHTHFKRENKCYSKLTTMEVSKDCQPDGGIGMEGEQRNNKVRPHFSQNTTVVYNESITTFFSP